MKLRITILTCFLLLFTLSLLPAQAISTCNPSSTTPGSTVTVSITGANVNFNSATTYSVELRSPLGAVLPMFQPTVTSSSSLTCDFLIPSNAVLGDYDLRVQTTAMTWVPGLFSVVGGAPNSLGSVSGHVFYDENQDCLQNGNEINKEGGVVVFLPGPYYAMTNAAGDYHAQLLPNTYSVYPFLGQLDLASCPAGSLTVNVASSATHMTGQDFGIEPNKVTDGAVWCSSTQTRPGFDQYHTLTVQNDGFYPITGVLEYILDTAYTYLSSNPIASSISGDTLRWNIVPSIPMLGFRNYEVTTNLPASVPLGTVLINKTHLFTDSLDVDSEDNATDCMETVIGSYDPNDKMVWNQDMVPADPHIQTTDSLLYYRIRFQNTGTASAINVFVRDTLDANLDASTFKTLSTSHAPVVISMNGDGNLEWRFDNINLPDSNSNEPESHGYILFSVKIKDGFGTGQTIKNKADIYFDFNDPVITNETQTNFVVGLPKPILGSPITVFPNPASDKIYVQANCDKRENLDVLVINAFGQQLRSVSGNCADGLIEIPVEDLSAGIYFVRTSMGEESWTQKVVIME